MRFSVLMSIYIKEKPEYFNRCMESIWDEQTIKPNEIILVEDGPLSDDLYNIIKTWKKKLNETLIVVSLDQNVGLGDALNEGIKHCSNELIARMDTDDISLPDRFKKQLKVFKERNIDICSAWISEFENDERSIISYRKLPENHDEIVKYSKTRSPVSHPAVIFKKAIVNKAGGYKKMLLMEDYYLWARMIVSGAKFYNIQEVLLNMRAGDKMLERRWGLKYAKSELALSLEFYRMGFLNIKEYIKILFIRVPIRFMPKGIFKIAYSVFRTKKR